MTLTLIPPSPSRAVPAKPVVDRTARVLQTAIEMEQDVEARYLRVGRAFTYGPIRRLFEEYAAEVRDHARILSRHLRDREMHLTPGRKLAPVDVPWVAALFEGVVPPWRRDEQTEGTPNRWFLNYM